MIPCQNLLCVPILFNPRKSCLATKDIIIVFRNTSWWGEACANCGFQCYDDHYSTNSKYSYIIISSVNKLYKRVLGVSKLFLWVIKKHKYFFQICSRTVDLKHWASKGNPRLYLYSPVYQFHNISRYCFKIPRKRRLQKSCGVTNVDLPQFH